MQSCGKFFYDIAVSRVQLKYCISIVHYFIKRSNSDNENIVRVNSITSHEESITDKKLNFGKCYGSV